MKYMLLVLVCLLSYSACAQATGDAEDEKAYYLNRIFASLEHVLDNAHTSATQIKGLHSLLVYKDGALCWIKRRPPPLHDT